INNRFALLSALYFLLVFIGGWWSEQQDSWFDIMQLHLPFLVLPLGMLTIPLNYLEFRKKFIIGMYTILLGVIIVSMGTFLMDPSTYIEGYSQSKQLPTIQEKDHIRFSLLLALSLIPGIAYLRFEAKVDQHRG